MGACSSSSEEVSQGLAKGTSRHNETGVSSGEAPVAVIMSFYSPTRVPSKSALKSHGSTPHVIPESPPVSHPLNPTEPSPQLSPNSIALINTIQAIPMAISPSPGPCLLQDLGGSCILNEKTGHEMDPCEPDHERTSDPRNGPLPSHKSEGAIRGRRKLGVRIAVMGRVQEPGVWMGEGPSSMDRESKDSLKHGLKGKSMSLDLAHDYYTKRITLLTINEEV